MTAAKILILIACMAAFAFLSGDAARDGDGFGMVSLLIFCAVSGYLATKAVVIWLFGDMPKIYLVVSDGK